MISISYNMTEETEIDHIIKELTAMKSVGYEAIKFGLDHDSDIINLYPLRPEDNE